MITEVVRVLTTLGREPCPDLAFKAEYILWRDDEQCLHATPGGEVHVVCIPVLTPEQRTALLGKGQ